MVLKYLCKMRPGQLPDKGGQKANLQKKPSVTFVDCARSDEETIKKWIFVTCKRAGVYADGVTCGKLANYCVYDMARIAQETEKLLGYCTAVGVERLTDDLVDELVYPDAEYKIYELANALARKNYSTYMRVVKDLSTRGFNETSLLSSLASYFKGLYETSLCKGSDQDVAAALDAIVEPMSLYEPVFHDNGQESMYVMDQIRDTENTDEAWLESISLKQALDALGERERKIIDLRFYRGKTQMEIAQEIGISQAQVSRLEKAALLRMRKEL